MEIARFDYENRTSAETTGDLENNESAFSLREPKTPPSTIVREGSSADVNTQLLGHGHRAKIPSTQLRNFVTNIICRIDPSPRSLAASHSSGTPYSVTHYVNYDNFSVHHRHFLAAISAGTEPQSFAEAMKDE